MKRLLLVLAGGLLFNASLCAQMGVTTISGKATHELKEPGFFAAHNRFPFDAKVKVRNNDTGAEIEVTILDYIPASPSRVIDLSLDAWEALGLAENTMITLTYTPPWAVTAQQAAPPSQFEEDEPFTITEFNSAQILYHLLIIDRIQCAPDSDITELENMELLYKFKHGKDGYLIALYTSSMEPVYPLLPEKSSILVSIITEREATLGEYVNSRAFKKHVTHRRETAEIQKIIAGLMSAAPPGMKIIPAMPNPNSGKTYQLQVGAYADPEIAGKAEQLLRDAGFNAVQEESDSWHRVLVAGIRAFEISFTLRRLAAAGFTEVWIR